MEHDERCGCMECVERNWMAHININCDCWICAYRYEQRFSPVKAFAYTEIGDWLCDGQFTEAWFDDDSFFGSGGVYELDTQP